MTYHTRNQLMRAFAFIVMTFALSMYGRAQLTISVIIKEFVICD
jgi:hypothetical protein